MENIKTPAGPLKSPRREKFAQACASGQIQTEAYKTAYPNSTKWKEGVVASRASDMARVDEVRARIKFLRGLVDQGTQKLFSLTKAEAAALVLEDAYEVARADVSQLITHRRLNCRYCHGTGHEYRWTDEAEFWAALAAAGEAQERWEAVPEARRRGKRPELPVDTGGYGFRRTHMPHAGCPQCEGEGIPDVFVADIRTLSGPARRAYAGVKIKKNGSIELLTRDKDAARQMLAKYAGVVDDTMKVTGVLGVTPLPQLTPEQVAEVAKRLENDC